MAVSGKELMIFCTIYLCCKQMQGQFIVFTSNYAHSDRPGLFALLYLQCVFHVYLIWVALGPAPGLFRAHWWLRSTKNVSHGVSAWPFSATYAVLAGKVQLLGRIPVPVYSRGVGSTEKIVRGIATIMLTCSSYATCGLQGGFEHRKLLWGAFWDT